MKHSNKAPFDLSKALVQSPASSIANSVFTSVTKYRMSDYDSDAKPPARKEAEDDDEELVDYNAEEEATLDFPVASDEVAKIDSLTEEVKSLKKDYEEAMVKIGKLEAENASQKTMIVKMRAALDAHKSTATAMVTTPNKEALVVTVANKPVDLYSVDFRTFGRIAAEMGHTIYNGDIAKLREASTTVEIRKTILSRPIKERDHGMPTTIPKGADPSSSKEKVSKAVEKSGGVVTRGTKRSKTGSEGV